MKYVLGLKLKCNWPKKMQRKSRMKNQNKKQENERKLHKHNKNSPKRDLSLTKQQRLNSNDTKFNMQNQIKQSRKKRIFFITKNIGKKRKKREST